MNSIRRGRRRPRLTSVSFRVFGWLLAHEAAYMVLCWQSDSPSHVRRQRAALCSVPTETLQLRVRRRLAWDDSRKVIP